MKILIASVSGDGGDGVAVEAQVLTYCPTATTEVVYYAAMSDAVAYAIANGFNGIARNVTDFDTDYAQAAIAQASNVWISWGHGSNSHILVSDPTALVDNAIGVGYGTAGVNSGSYGPALDFFVNGAPNESQACGIIAGKMGQLLIDNPSYNFEGIRDKMRRASSNWSTYETDGGYGSIDLSSLGILPTYGFIYDGRDREIELSQKKYRTLLH